MSVLRQCLQRGIFTEALDNVCGSSLCDAGDVQVEFLHSGVVLQSRPELQNTLWAQVITTHTVYMNRGIVLQQNTHSIMSNDSY